MELTLVLFGFAFFGSPDSIGNLWRLGIDEKYPGKLVTKGIYAFTRNPIYLFFHLYFLGTFFLRDSAITCYFSRSWPFYFI